ncbi:MAG: hypothetical protein DMF89_02740 [Acidobacteria bacterium]|nr:MAG: hypothetical protein DMF89_02740 [Acidobacteriota bacterium]
MEVNTLAQTAVATLVAVAWKVAGAVVLWLLGRWLIVAILGFFGVETTTFAALLAAGGVAIGVAWGGLLANFAAGAFLADNISNFSANPYRRVDLTAIINNTVDHHSAIRILKAGLAKVPNVLATPAPDVDVLQYTAAGPLLIVRPYCQQQHYWQVYFDSNRMIREAFGQAGFPAPAPAYVVTGPRQGAPVADLSS